MTHISNTIPRQRTTARPKVQCTCGFCGKTFFIKASLVDLGCGKFCNKKCYDNSKVGPKIPFLERFWYKSLIGDGCWEWQATKNEHGYGFIGVGSRRSNAAKHCLAHRMAYELVYGKPPDSLGVLHKCDNPACIRPDHLFLGDQLANMQDAVAKNRVKCGEQKRQAILKASQIPEIRRLKKEGLSQEKIAAMFGVKRTCIARVVTGVSWKHVQ